ncbi:uncharacterized protein LOC117652613 [Thrips palmi]|uniref:Uncharacterized protein LOC117652613 n=1 Tax=Thrips palmi TaxID=161013 RepID=A0A6P9A8F6_THRPL|nr:uncharacterized protein LOC117652613 [Thrips palmi]
MTLPALPSNLKAMIGKANSCMEKFIAHYGHYLRTVTEDLISKADYKIFSLTIIKAHPELSDPTNVENPNHLVKDMLSMFVRNARRKDKFVPLSLTDDHEEPARKKQRKFIMPSESVTSRTEAEASEMNKLQEALKGIGPNVGATTHHTRLIRETFVPRREWISHLPPDSSPTLIIHEYPHLQKVDLICYEFSLMRKKDVLSLQSDLGDAVQSIANFISLPSRTERERADFLCKLYNDVKPKNVSKKLPPCFSIQQCQGDPDVHLKSEAGEGARLVFFFDTEDKLGAAFIVGDTLAMPVNNPTVCGSLLALLACYHAWDLTYPPAFKCVLLIFDVHGLGTITNDLNGAFKKFNIDYSRFKLSQTF